MFVRFARPRDGRGERAAHASATVRRDGIIYLNPAAHALLGDATHVHFAVDEEDQAIAILPATPSTKSYALSQFKSGRHAQVFGRLLLRQYAVKRGRYRVSPVTTLGLTGLAFHYIRTDRTGQPPTKGSTS